MGVKDLLSWIKKNHPSAVVSFPKRWASPEIRGKRIAIDATLLTNRYHFAITDGPLRGKGALVGWYNILSIMRSHDIRPVAIWDEPGVREWKAVETRRRIAARMLASARRQHEDERQDRLSDLRDGLTALQALPEEEQEAVRLALRPSGSSATPDPTIPLPAIQAGTSATPSSTSEDTSEESIERIATMTDTLRDVVGRYTTSLRTSSGQRVPDMVDDVVGHLAELEKLSRLVGQTEAELDYNEEERRRLREAAREFVDRKAGELLPADGFKETKRQSELTLEEGRIIKEILDPQGADHRIDGASGTTSSPAESEPGPSSTSPTISAPEHVLPLEHFDSVYGSAADVTPLERLDTLIEAAPPVRDIYERALFLPTPETHQACRDLVERLGVPILRAKAPYEAEGLATSLALEGVVDWVGTEDSDVIALGGPLLKGLSSANSPLDALQPASLLTLLSLTRPQLIDFCILLGNDACPRIHGIGPISSYKLIVKHGSIENILANEEKVRNKVLDMPEYMEMVSMAREVFGTLPPVSDEVKRELQVSLEGMTESKVDLEEVERWLEEGHGIRFVGAGEALE